MDFWDEQYHRFEELDLDVEIDDWEQITNEKVAKVIDSMFAIEITSEIFGTMLWEWTSFPVQPFNSYKKSMKAWIGQVARLAEESDGDLAEARKINREEIKEVVRDNDRDRGRDKEGSG